jgi:hypothetical protein
MRVHGEPRFLILDSFNFLVRFVKMHPTSGSFVLLAVFLVVLGILKRIFGRIAGDVILFALIVWAIVLIFGSSFFSFIHVQGFHFGG